MPFYISAVLLLAQVLVWMFGGALALQPGNFKLWQLFTYALVHGNVLHLVINVWAIFFCGIALQDIAGGARVLWWFVLSVLAGAVAHLLLSSVPVMGASAGALGLLGAYAELRPNKTFDFFIGAKIKLKHIMLAVLALNLVLGVVAYTHIAAWAHIGGALCGWLCGLYLLYAHPNAGNRSGKFPKFADINIRL